MGTPGQSIRLDRMPRNARCFDVLIASPSDVQAERQVISECIEDWNSQHSRATGTIIQPRRWELDAMPETGARPQSFINRQIVDVSDMLIGVFWSRLGSPSGVAASGTVEEINRLVDAGKPVALYFSKVPLPYDHDQTQLAAVQEYKKRIQQTALYFEFPDREQLRRLVSLHLGQRMHELAGTPFEPPETGNSQWLPELDVEVNWLPGFEWNGNGLIVSNLSSGKNLYNIHFDPVQTPLGEVKWEPAEMPCLRAGKELKIAPVFADPSLREQQNKQRICQFVYELFDRKLADNHERFDALSLNIQCEDEDNMRYEIRAPIVHVPGAPIQVGRLVRQRSIEPPPTPKIAAAALSIRIGNPGRSGDVRTMQVIFELENLSKSRLSEYSCDVSVPKAALTFSSAGYISKIASKDSSREAFRFSEGISGPIFPGDTRQLATLELGIDQLKMKGTYLHGDYEGTLADKVYADANIGGEIHHAEMPLSEIFAS
jgi:hypothetical protein